ncbi:MAG: OmpA family protein [Pseudomonadota bacterium]
MLRIAVPLLLLGGMAQALTLELPPGAEVTREIIEENATRAIPSGPTQEGFTPTVLSSGTVARRAIRVPNSGDPNTTALMLSITEQLAADGFTEVYSCQTQSCGGFDFRFALDLIPAPEMFVDLGDFQYFTAQKADEHVTVVTSRSQADGYLHIERITKNDASVVIETSPALDLSNATPSSIVGEPLTQRILAAVLESNGSLVLEDLIFPSGTTELPDDEYPSLTALAGYLNENPDRTVALVGHTDAAGSLQMNIEVSRRRAETARTKLIDRYGVAAEQVAAEGMGYLAPRTTNLTEEGRGKNRRVEVILTSTRP